jgi:hypothetical protein
MGIKVLTMEEEEAAMMVVVMEEMVETVMEG